jgi:hypothetical protein
MNFPPALHPFCQPFSRLHMLYAKLEEEHGLARHALSIYNRATKAVEEKALLGHLGAGGGWVWGMNLLRTWG